MQYAVIKSGGKQYKVQVGDTITLDRLDTEKNKIIFDDILLLVNDGKVVVGDPQIKGAKVEAALVEHKRGKKIEVRKFKAKSRYRKKIGFRANQTVVRVEKIDYKIMFASKNAAKPTKTAPKKTNK